MDEFIKLLMSGEVVYGEFKIEPTPENDIKVTIAIPDGPEDMEEEVGYTYISETVPGHMLQMLALLG